VIEQWRRRCGHALTGCEPIAVAVLLVLGLATACGERAAPRAPAASKGTSARPVAEEFHVNVHFAGVEEPVFLVLDGKQSGPYRRNPASQIDFVTIDIDPASRDLSRLSARILLPCGWRETKLRERHRYPSGAVAAELAPSFKTRRMLVDNRGGTGETFSVGEWQRAVAANEVGSFLVPMPDCATAELKLGSRGLGIFMASAGTQDRETYLVDPTGRRCYEYSIAYYHRVDAPAPAIVDSPARFARGTLHLLPGMPNHVFERAPRTIKEWAGLKSATRTQLLEIGC
jgi:hypothetical protein